MRTHDDFLIPHLRDLAKKSGLGSEGCAYHTAFHAQELQKRQHRCTGWVHVDAMVRLHLLHRLGDVLGSAEVPGGACTAGPGGCQGGACSGIPKQRGTKSDLKTYARGNNDAPSISKYGSLVRADAQIAALR